MYLSILLDTVNVTGPIFILVALGVVFWPIIFVQPEANHPLGEPAQIPQRPDIDSTSIAPASPQGLRPSAPLGDIAAYNTDVAASEAVDRSVGKLVPAKALPKAPTVAVRTRTEAPTKPKVDADGVPVGWILQVASITSAEKAEQLRSRLLAMGYKAYVKKIRNNNSVLMRVYVGPKFEREKLEAMQAAVDAEFGVKSMVRRYIP